MCLMHSSPAILSVEGLALGGDREDILYINV